ncbi:MAG: 50S ribosomal protein L3 N(5)-glutamine methyltransferase [Proteobacteria bacterium]|nr:50S ribosomal protein L3 N(5)-glutamine methyltransferase [Pseudomonadota bacterium]HQR03374.1 50S ribosomal protein L3 N(5)-glutamine methyltransferase [Rhodocyclaceae bacterium]
MLQHPGTDLHTIHDWLRWAVSRFCEADLCFGHGCDNPYDEAAWLILASLNLRHDQLETFRHARLTVTEKDLLFERLHRRIEERIPVAYLVNEAWLGDFRFYVDERVIVPRSYFAELLEESLAPWVEAPEAIESALDLCTGSGCLAILMTHAFPGARVDAVDLSPDALDVARINLDAYGLEDEIELIRSDVFDHLGARRYDLIVSNPPYVTQASMDNIPQEYLCEPELALVAGNDGLDVVRRILAGAAGHLTENGLLMVEVGHNADLVEAAWPHVPFTWVDAPSGESRIFLLSRQELESHFLPA